MIFDCVLLSLKLSLITSFILFVVCLYPAYIFARKDFWGKKIITAIISLPLVLPPTVLGFYLLVVLSPHSSFGQFLQSHGIRLVFNFPSLVIASLIYSLPFMFNPIYTAFMQLPKSLFERAFLLEKSTLNIIFRLAVPMIKPSIFSALVMTFAHTMGEFGVVMMVGGSIDGETKTASIAVFEALENLDYASAHEMSLVLLAISFAILLPMQFINSKQ